MTRRASAAPWALAAALLAGACDDGGGDDEASVSVELFSAHFRVGTDAPTPIDLHSTDPVASAEVQELEIVVASPEPGVPLRTELYELFAGGAPTGRGRLADLSLEQPQQIFVRGFVAGGADPLVYGASDVFSVADGDRRLVGVQIGRADCVGLNAAPEAVQGPRGSIDFTAGRVGATMTLLPDGRVAIIGGAVVDGQGAFSQIHDTIEVYDTNQGQFFTTAARLLEPRVHHTATHLGGGKVLVFGGLTVDPASGEQVIAREAVIVDLADEAAPVQRVAGVLDAGLERHQHEATVIRERTGEISVLFTGGYGPDGKPQKSTLRFFPGETGDPTRGELVTQGPLCEARVHHSATALVGRTGELAVVAGGLRELEDGTREPIASVEVFSVNPSQNCVCADASPSGRFGCFVKPTGRNFEEPRWGHRAVRVDDDRQVLFVGGYATADRAEQARGLEMLDFELQMHGPGEVGSLPRGVGELTATPIPVGFFPDGSDDACTAPEGGSAGVCRPEHHVVLTGGRRGNAPVAEVLRLVPSRERGTQALRAFRTREIDDACGLSEARFGHQAVRLRTGTILLGGGVIGPDGARSASKRAELFFPVASDVKALFPTPASLTLPPTP